MVQEKAKIKRIGIDARFYGPTGKGLGRYAQELVDNLIRLDEENEYVIFLNENNFDEFDVKEVLGPSAEEKDLKRIKKVKVNARWYTAKEQMLLPFYIWRENLDLMHFLHFNVPVFTFTKFTVTVHDLILTKFPTLRASTLSPLTYRIKNFLYKTVIWLAVKRAKKIITVSEFTKKDVVEKFKIKAEKIFVTYEGVANLSKGRDSLFAKKLNEEEALNNYQINKPFILYVGNAYPHKNLEKLLAVWQKIQKDFGKQEFVDKDDKKWLIEDVKIVFVGKEDFFYKRLKDYAKEKKLFQEKDENSKVIFSGYVPDSSLEILYKQALFYIFPSLYEGFGLPPLEAMAKSCAVLSSKESCLQEVLGEAAMYFDPNNEKEMMDKIIFILKDETVREDLIKKGLKQVKKYNWWECARQTREVYNLILFK